MRLKIVSVIIPAFNSWPTLKVALKSLQNQTILPFEVIVVDNNSIDGTPSKVKRYFPKVKLIKQTKNGGVVGGRNVGIDAANKKSNYLLFLDHDMNADNDMLEELITPLGKDKVGITTPKIYYQSHKDIIWAAGTNINLWTGRVLFRGGVDRGQFEDQAEVQVAPAAIMVKRSVIDRIGSFDPRYFLTFEDTDFCFRAKRSGLKTVYTPKAIAFHKLPIEQKLSNQRLLDRAYWVGRNRTLFMKDFGRSFSFFLLFSPVYLAYFLYLALVEQNPGGFISYLRGYIAGIWESFDLATMLPWTYPNLLKKLIPDGSIVLDLGCGDGKLMSKVNNRGNLQVTGVDVNSVELRRARRFYQELARRDFTKKLNLKGKFDIVLCSQVVEHLKKIQAIKLIKQMERLAVKRVVIATINGYFEFDTHQIGEYDHHQSGWSKQEFKRLGYQVRGSGLSLVYRPGGLKDTLPNFIRPLLFILSYLSTPILAFFITPANFLIAWKDK